MPLHHIAADADAFLKSEAEAGRFRGAVLLAQQGEVLLRSGYGLANEEWQIPNTATTKFRIGSVTKTFTATAILRLVETGALDLDGTIGTWIEDLPAAWQPLTVHQLLTHTAGLRDHLAVPAKRTLNLTGAQPVDLIALIAAEPLLFTPGTSRSYSNTGYILLGMLIETVSNRTYAHYLNEALLSPLELTATSYDQHSRILPERASGYIQQAGNWQNAGYLDMTVPFSAGGLISTVDDLLRWNTASHESAFLTPDSYEKMTAEYPETKKQDGFYGYGWFIGKKSGYICLSHSGGVNGFIAMLEYYPELRGSLVLLANVFDPRTFQMVLEQLATIFLNGAEN